MAEPFVRLEEILATQAETMRLRLVTGAEGLRRIIKHPRLQKPSLAFAGFTQHLDDYCMQVIGQTEVAYMATRTPEQQRRAIDAFFDLRVAAVVLTRGISPTDDFLRAAARTDTPLLISELSSSDFMMGMMLYLSKRLAPVDRCHGVFMDVFGQGVILRGDSGCGKSEIALELITRGHRLIADDCIELRREASETLVGRCPEELQDYLEVRGLGFINVRHLFGSSAISRSKRVTLVVRFIDWRDFSQESRVESMLQHEEIHGVRLPVVRIPVRPGRSLAVLVEVATRSHLRREQGADDHAQFLERMNARIMGGGV